MTVISVSLTSDLLQRLDEFVERSGYSSRSEAIRLAVRDVLSEFALQRIVRGRVVATVTVISDRDRHDITSRLMNLRHEFNASIFSNMHLHIGSGHCVEVFVVQGSSEVVLDFISRVRAVRDIREVKYTMTPIERNA